MSEQILWSFQHPWKFDSEPISFRGPPSVSLLRNRQSVPAREGEHSKAICRRISNLFTLAINLLRWSRASRENTAGETPKRLASF